MINISSRYVEKKNWKVIVKYLEETLYEYPVLKTSIENEQELIKEGCPKLIPFRIARDERLAEDCEQVSLEKKHKMLLAEKRLKINQIERALEILSAEEKIIIEEKYFNPVHLVDFVIYERLGLSRSTYQRLKKIALKKLAMALNLM